MLTKIYLILMLASSLELSAMEITTERSPIFSFPDSFYPLEKSDPKLRELLVNFYQAVEKVKDNKHELKIMLRTENKHSPITALSSYLAQHDGLREMRENVQAEAIVSGHSQWRKVIDEDIQIMAISTLESISRSRKSLEFLRPVLSRYENYIYLVTSDETSRNEALSFLLLSVLNKMLAPLYIKYSSASESTQLIMRMICRNNFTQRHEAFLIAETSLGREAFKFLNRLSHNLIAEPMVDHYILYLLLEYLVTLDANILKDSSRKEKIVAQWLKKNCTPMGGLEYRIAHIAVNELNKFESSTMFISF